MLSAVVAGGGQPLAHTGAPDWAAEPPLRGCGIPRPPSPPALASHLLWTKPPPPHIYMKICHLTLKYIK